MTTGDAKTIPMVGRRAEFERITALTAGAAAGNGGSMLVLGTSGSGRSRLLREAADHAERVGLSVRIATGRRSERSVTGAVVSELLDMHDVSPASVLDHCVRLSASSPLLLAVDDVDLCDQPSLAVLEYCARRVVRHPIAILLAGAASMFRTDSRSDGEAHEFDDVEQLFLDGLDDQSICELFALVAGSLSTDAIERARELSGGNPLAVIELARASNAAQRAGTEPFADLPPVGEALIRSFAQPMLTLPEATRRALCVVAAEPTGRIDVIARALECLGEDLNALEPAEVAGTLSITDGLGEFDHPMRRIVAYASLAMPSRRAAHRALAQAWDQPIDGAHRMRHLIVGTSGPHAQVAADLQLLAEHFERSGESASAATAWGHAASLSTTAADRDRRAAAGNSCRPAGEFSDRPMTGRLAVLTAAELRVAREIAHGVSNRQAAQQLFVSHKTVDAHLQAIFRKLDVNTRTALAVLVALHDAEGSR